MLTTSILLIIAALVVLWFLYNVYRSGLSKTFASVDYIIRSSQTSLVNLISSVTPWVAPLAPAMLTYKNSREILGLGDTNSLFIAITVEFLGLSSVHTIFEFWFHNTQSRKGDKVPLGAIVLASVTLVIYLSVVILVNVFLDVESGVSTNFLLAKAGFTLLTLPAAIIMALRAQHGSILQKSQLKDAGLSRKEIAEMLLGNDVQSHSGNLPEISGKLPSRQYRFPNDWRLVSDDDKKELLSMSAKQICENADIDERTARLWVKRLRNA